MWIFLCRGSCPGPASEEQEQCPVRDSFREGVGGAPQDTALATFPGVLHTDRPGIADILILVLVHPRDVGIVPDAHPRPTQPYVPPPRPNPTFNQMGCRGLKPHDKKSHVISSFMKADGGRPWDELEILPRKQ